MATTTETRTVTLFSSMSVSLKFYTEFEDHVNAFFMRDIDRLTKFGIIFFCVRGALDLQLEVRRFGVFPENKKKKKCTV